MPPPSRKFLLGFQSVFRSGRSTPVGELKMIIRSRVRGAPRIRAGRAAVRPGTRLAAWAT